MTQELADGWYLMSTSDLERELANWRSHQAGATGSHAQPLTTEEALAFRDRGNLPDERGRTLRLVLHVDDSHQLANLDRRRIEFEPDYHDAPKWRREGSRPINVVPLRRSGVAPVTTDAWWEVPELADLEREYEEYGTAGGVRVPGEYRGFVFKTVLALRSQGREVTSGAISDSIARWLSDDDAARIARAMEQLNR